ncbi:MAG: acyl-CoA desaturase [Myxococcales bacterium]|nr:MAG: acyl-CoA desaturase [Myxococcales bacterium]
MSFHTGAAIILTFFLLHWASSVFSQTFFLHRYAAHGMFKMNKFWERFFHLFTFVTQGSSYLVPRAYAILHREHHAFSDTERDPHSPHIYKNLSTMMWATKERYTGFVRHRIQPEARFEGDYPVWNAVDRLGDLWLTRLAWGTFYTLFYIAFAPHWLFFLLLPIHFLMGPVHGAIVNWAGHKYGYRNFDTADKSKNTLVWDLLTFGELYQNNHHKHASSAKFAQRWFEFDPTYPVIVVLGWLKVIQYPLHKKRKLSGAQPPALAPAE